ncbi:kelch-like protein 32 [Amphiura filiformis]|uniref:kelch-like protein 32 n=1 Tax=Amphiura filiformis TaxID=82378 RepID=UPI003B20EEE7
MFTSGFKERSENEINISGNAAALKILLNFAYTGELNDSITADNMYDVIEMACYTQFTDFAKECSGEIIDLFSDEAEDKIAVCDAYKICLLARNHEHLKSLLQASVEFLDDHVDGLKNLEIFLHNTSYTFLQELLSREYLSSETEEKQVLELVLNWLKHDWENRHIHAHPLLQKVRLGLIASDDINELVGAEILKIQECSDMMNHVLQMQASEKSSETLSFDDPSMFTTRSTITAPIASVRRDGKKNFEFYNDKRGSWMDLHKLAPLPTDACHFSTIVVDGKLYAAGGMVKAANHQKVCLKDFHRYHAVENRWVALAPLITARRNFPLLYLDGFIYAIGGMDVRKSQSLIHVERYNVAENTWETVETLPEECHSLSAVEFKGKILVCGTRNHRYTHKLMIYHVETNAWQCVDLGPHFSMTPRQNKVSVLFVYNHQCYRILYNYVDREDGFTGVPTVNELDIVSQDNDIIVTMGEKVKQDLIRRDEGEFCIGDEVFMIQKGFVMKTDMLMTDGYNYGVKSIGRWSMFNVMTDRDRSNVTLFTFDRKKLSNDESLEE